MNAQAEHASALASLRADGAPVSFVLHTGGAYDENTNRFTGGGSNSVAGYALKTGGKPATYERLKLVESEAPTLFFVPSVFNTKPALNSRVQWGGDTFTVRDVDVLAPDGNVITANVVISR